MEEHCTYIVLGTDTYLAKRSQAVQSSQVSKVLRKEEYIWLSLDGKLRHKSSVSLCQRLYTDLPFFTLTLQNTQSGPTKVESDA